MSDQERHSQASNVIIDDSQSVHAPDQNSKVVVAPVSTAFEGPLKS